MREKPSQEEIARRAASFDLNREPLILPAKPCPRCTPLGQSRGRGQIWIPVDQIYVKCSKCNGKGIWVAGVDA